MAACQHGQLVEELSLKPIGTVQENTLYPKVLCTQKAQTSLQPCKYLKVTTGHGPDQRTVLPSEDGFLLPTISTDMICQEEGPGSFSVPAEPEPSCSTSDPVASPWYRRKSQEARRHRTTNSELRVDNLGGVKDNHPTIGLDLGNNSIRSDMVNKVQRLPTTSLNGCQPLPILPHPPNRQKFNKATAIKTSANIAKDPKVCASLGAGGLLSHNRGAYTPVPTVGPMSPQDGASKQPNPTVSQFTYPQKLSNTKGCLVHVCRCNQANITQAPQSRPPDYHIYVLSALAMCFMCPPFGITALVFTLQAQTLHRKGLTDQSRISICFAFKWMMAGSVATIIMILTASGIQAFLYFRSPYKEGANGQGTTPIPSLPGVVDDWERDILVKRLSTVVVPRSWLNPQDDLHDEILDKLGNALKSKLRNAARAQSKSQQTTVGPQKTYKEDQGKQRQPTRPKQPSLQATAQGTLKDKETYR